MSFEETGTGAVLDSETTTDFNGGFEGTNGDAAFGTDSAPVDFLDTPAAKLAPKQPEIHQGIVTSIDTVTANTGSVGINVHLQSKDTGAADKYTIWAPKEFFDPANWTGGKFSLESLSTDVAPGKKQSPRQRYAATINSESAGVGKDGSLNNYADVQLLRQIAKDEGRTLAGAQPPTDGVAFVALLNELCAGISVVYTRRPEANENSEYDGQLKVNRILHPSVLSLANFDKKFPPLTPTNDGSFKGYRRAWE